MDSSKFDLVGDLAVTCLRPMPDEISPIFRVADGRRAAAWYARLGFEAEGEHRFAPGLPLYLLLRRNGASLHLSEHTGDAQPGTLVYMSVDDLDAVAAECEAGLGRERRITALGRSAPSWTLLPKISWGIAGRKLRPPSAALSSRRGRR